MPFRDPCPTAKHQPLLQKQHGLSYKGNLPFKENTILSSCPEVFLTFSEMFEGIDREKVPAFQNLQKVLQNHPDGVMEVFATVKQPDVDPSWSLQIYHHAIRCAAAKGAVLMVCFTHNFSKLALERAMKALGYPTSTLWSVEHRKLSAVQWKRADESLNDYNKRMVFANAPLHHHFVPMESFQLIHINVLSDEFEKSKTGSMELIRFSCGQVEVSKQKPKQETGTPAQTPGLELLHFAYACTAVTRKARGKGLVVRGGRCRSVYGIHVPGSESFLGIAAVGLPTAFL